MNTDERTELYDMVLLILADAITTEYARKMMEHEEVGTIILADVEADIIASSAWETEHRYNQTDVKLALGRILLEMFGVEQ